jgi:hypothetical protein
MRDPFDLELSDSSDCASCKHPTKKAMSKLLVGKDVHRQVRTAVALPQSAGKPYFSWIDCLGC